MREIVSNIAKAVGLGIAGLALIGASDKVQVGSPAPPATITLVDGSKVTLEQLRGEVVVLNFWATWCVPCRTELPILDRYYDLQRKHGLRVFAVTTEGSVPLYQMKKLFAAMKIPAAKKISGVYATVSAVPTNYVIDRAGRIRYAKSGAFDLDELNTLIVPLLREPALAARKRSSQRRSERSTAISVSSPTMPMVRPTCFISYVNIQSTSTALTCVRPVSPPGCICGRTLLSDARYEVSGQSVILVMPSTTERPPSGLSR